MTARTGAQTPIVIANSSTFEVGVSAVSGAMAFANSFNQSRNVNVLRANPIGSGNYMDGTDTQQGSDSPTVTIAKDLHYDDAGNKLLAQFFGTAAAPMTMATGAYQHSILFNETQHSFWNCIAIGPTSDGVMEWPSCATRNVTVASSAFPGPVVATFESIANTRRTSPTSNGVDGLNAATVANTKRVIAKTSDLFVINAQASGALSSTTDKVAITGFNITYAKPLEHVYEMRGSAGNSQPRITGDPPLKVTLQITFRNLADFTYFTAAGAGTAYKAELQITGDLITGSTYYFYKFCFPYLKVLDDPTYDIAGPNENEHTVTFEALMAASAPTGMVDVYPYVLILNNKSAAYSAAG